MNSLPVWCGVNDGFCEPSWDPASAAASLRLTEILQVLNEAFDSLAAEAVTRNSEAA
jgi:hypothetical protein